MGDEVVIPTCYTTGKRLFDGLYELKESLPKKFLKDAIQEFSVTDQEIRVELYSEGWGVNKKTDYPGREIYISSRDFFDYLTGANESVGPKRQKEIQDNMERFFGKPAKFRRIRKPTSPSNFKKE